MKNLSQNPHIEQETSDFLRRITNSFDRFGKSDFDTRKKVLEILNREQNNEKNNKLRRFIIQVESIFLDTHIRLTVDSIRERYGITGRPTQKDFYRICAGERIEVVNSMPEAQAKKIKVGCLFTATNLDGVYCLNFDERGSRRDRLRCQFHLLGNYFLHKGELPSENEIFDEKVKRADTQKEEAALFAVRFLDVKPEVKR